ERRDLAGVAAGGAGGARVVEAVDAVVTDERLELVALGIDGADAPAVAPLGLGPQVVGFAKQAARIEGHDVDIVVGAGTGQEMEDDLILRPEACGEHDPPPDLAAQARDPLGRRKTMQDIIEMLGAQRRTAAASPAGLLLAIQSKHEPSARDPAADVQHEPP